MTGKADYRGMAGIHLALFLISAALLSLEIILTRILVVVMWHHFASLVISLALLGMTLGALAVYFWPALSRSSGGRPSSLPFSAALMAATSSVIFAFFWFLSRYPLTGYRFFSVFHQAYFEPFGAKPEWSASSFLPFLLVYFLFTAAPFFAGGVFVTSLFRRYGQRSGTLYAADLLGAGFGCYLAVLLLNLADGPSALLLAAIPALIAAMIVAGNGRNRWGLSIFGAALLSAALLNIFSPYARLMFVRGRYQPDILFEKWSATSRVVVYPLSGSQEEGSWGQSRLFPGELPRQLGLVVDDTGYTNITAYPEDGDLDFMRYNLLYLPYILKPQAETLIIGPGGGRDILAALASEAGRITAVEINPLVVEAVDGFFGSFAGRLYSRPPVTTHVAEGRNFLKRDKGKYDILQASVVYGRLPPSAGAFTLSENQLYTRESFREYMDHLKDDGFLAITRFLFEKRTLRLVSLGRAALEEAGYRNPGEHFFIAAERGLATVILKKKPFLPEELDGLQEHCRKMGFRVLYSPSGGGRNNFYRLLEAEGTGDFQDRFPFDISPPSDDRPYFYYLLKPHDFWRSIVAHGQYEFEDRAIIIVRNACIVLALFAISLILLPLVGRSGKGGRSPVIFPSLLYFGGIALGFIIVEIVLLKSLILYLGYPVLSLSIVLASLLVSAGLGSFFSRRIIPGTRPLRLVYWLLLIILAVPLFHPLARTVTESTIWAPLPLRMVIAALIIFPLGFILGIPFPTGLKMLVRRDADLVPWALGINGAFSVTGAMLAMILALNYGFRLTLMVAPLGYVAAVLSLVLFRREER